MYIKSIRRKSAIRPSKSARYPSPSLSGPPDVLEPTTKSRCGSAMHMYMVDNRATLCAMCNVYRRFYDGLFLLVLLYGPPQLSALPTCRKSRRLRVGGTVPAVAVGRTRLPAHCVTTTSRRLRRRVLIPFPFALYRVIEFR